MMSTTTTSTTTTSLLLEEAVVDNDKGQRQIKTTIDVEDVKQQEQMASALNSTEICFVGYVLDTYCINRGTLLDGYETASLEEPFRHSIHCLVDVPRCRESGFELLMDPVPQTQQAQQPENAPSNDDDADNNADLYCRAFQLDQRGNDLLLDLARSSGAQGYCTTCRGPPGAISRGFRATVYGTIDSSSQNSPPLLQVSRVASIRDGCQGTAPYIPSASELNCSSGNYLPYMAAHGSLMLISWGFLLPLGVISAKLLKNPDQPNATLWFTIHRIVQPTGIIVALAGWITALAGPFNVLGSGVYDFQFVHALVGTTVMAIGLLQPINAYFRPHKNADMEMVSQNRRLWEWCHKGLGYVAIVLGLVNCFIGMALSGKYQNQIFQAIVAAWACLFCSGVVLLVRRCWQSYHHNGHRGGPQQQSSPTAADDEIQQQTTTDLQAVELTEDDGMFEVTVGDEEAK